MFMKISKLLLHIGLLYKCTLTIAFSRPPVRSPSTIQFKRSHDIHSMHALPPQSLPPINNELSPSEIASVRDYFLPTESQEATRKALEQFARKQEQAKGQLDIVRSSDFIQFDTAMPGNNAYKQIERTKVDLPTPTYNKEISKKEINWIAQQFDTYLSKLPQAAILFALVDFFVLPTSKPVYSDELEEDRVEVVKEFVGRSLVRLGVFSGIVVITLAFENIFNNPV